MNKKFDSIDFLLRFALVFYSLMFIGLVGCTTDELDELVPTPSMELDGRLPIDANGYYHLELNDTSTQTIHRVTGRVLYIKEPTKIGWESNLYWNSNEGLVPTTNCCSYVGDEGEINTVIAPIYNMQNDTLVLTATINEWGISETINIVLD